MNEIDINIRLANDEDFDRIYEIWTSGIGNSFKVDINEELKQNFKDYFNLREDYFNYWVAENNGNVLGWVSINRNTLHPLKKNHFAELSIYFDNNHKIAKLPTILQNYVCEYLGKHSPIKYLISFIAEDNKPVRRFCLNSDWQFIGNFPKNDNPDKDVRKTIIAMSIS